MVYRITWHSNPPWAGSGYGNQTALFTDMMIQDKDFEPTVSAFWGLGGAPMQAKGMRILPASIDGYGNDVIKARFDATKADAFVGLIDLWVFNPDVLQSRPFTWWVPVDHDPIPEMVLDRLQYVSYPWAMSKHGHKQMTNSGILAEYVPHGTNIEHYKPTDRKAARAKLDYLEDDTFFIVSVAANKGKEDRKNLRGMIHAFAQHVSNHPNSQFYIHTEPDGLRDGVNVRQLVNQLGLQNHVHFPDLFRMIEGQYQYPQLNEIYNAADVFLLPSAGEGFGIPVIEAQAAGCPVIVNDFTAQGELVGAGFKIGIDSDDFEYSVYGSYRARVRVSKIVAALKLAMEWKNDETIRKTARAFIKNEYDYKHVWTKYMKPALIRQIEGRRKREALSEKRTQQRISLRPGEDTQELLVASMMAGD